MSEERCEVFLDFLIYQFVAGEKIHILLCYVIAAINPENSTNFLDQDS